jgi:RHS repeat-associated protein
LVQWTLTDHLNTVRDIAKYNPGTDTTTVVNHLVYDAFGRVTSETNPAVESLFLFTARPFDADTGLQNNLNRWYDPAVGRWLSEDPVGYDAGDINLFRYCANNPVLYTDPSGSDWLDCMTACVHDNDPINLAVEAAVAQFTIGLWPKRIFAAMADAMGDHRLGNAIRFSAHYGETTTMPKALLTLMRAKPHKAFDVLLRYGGKTVGRANIAYGLALAAIEVHCCGYCTAAAAYGVPYNPRDANMYDTIRRTYFSWL